MSIPSLLTPYGYSSSTCGYCTPSGSRSAGPTSKKYGMVAEQMSCQFYQDLIDRGWRRSGTYVYQPDMARTCCPQYTIRLDAQAFKVNKKHRQVVNRLNRWLGEGIKPGDGNQSEGQAKGKGKGKAKAGEWEFMTELRRFEEGWGGTGQHRYETELVPAKATDETFHLYKKYQVAVHKDDPEDVSLRGYKRFLCDSPLNGPAINYHKDADTTKLPQKYGSYHLLYRIDGKLVGISVVDILPLCVSSVYFIWDPEYAWASLGKISALREVALARDIREAGAKDMGWVYMGYWIPGCGKMVYKSEYAPSYLLEPDTHRFHLLTPVLDKFLRTHTTGYFPFSEIEGGRLDDAEPSSSKQGQTGEGEDTDMGEEEEEIDDFPTEHTAGWSDPASFTDEQIEGLMLLMKGRLLSRPRLLSIGDLSFGDAGAVYRQIREMVAVIGLDSMGQQGTKRDDLEGKGVLFFG